MKITLYILILGFTIANARGIRAGKNNFKNSEPIAEDCETKEDTNLGTLKNTGRRLHLLEVLDSVANGPPTYIPYVQRDRKGNVIDVDDETDSTSSWTHDVGEPQPDFQQQLQQTVDTSSISGSWKLNEGENQTIVIKNGGLSGYSAFMPSEPKLEFNVFYNKGKKKISIMANTCGYGNTCTGYHYLCDIVGPGTGTNMSCQTITTIMNCSRGSCYKQNEIRAGADFTKAVEPIGLGLSTSDSKKTEK